MIYSPLRYPGGKNKLSAFIAKLCVDNNVNGHYVEPYSGGASVALFLLLEGYVAQITINDMDRSIYAFWHSVLNKTEELCELIEKAELTIEEWRRQKSIQLSKEEVDLLTLGFSTFYLNRTNRSGIINAGVIGGIEQEGEYLMDCRFNKENLIQRVRRIEKKKKSILLCNMDAIDLIDKIQGETINDNVIFYFDPPYYLKASSLYMNHYQNDDHETVSDKIKSIRNIKWIVSYDNVPEINDLYEGYPKKEFAFKHTAYKSRLGKEVLFFSDNINRVDLSKDPIKYRLKRNKNNKVISYLE